MSPPQLLQSSPLHALTLFWVGLAVKTRASLGEGKGKKWLYAAFRKCYRNAACVQLLVLVVLHADLELVYGFVDGPDRFYAMTAEVMRRVFEVLLGIAQGFQSFLNLRMLLGRCRGDRRRLCGGSGRGIRRRRPGRPMPVRELRRATDLPSFLRYSCAYVSS